MLFTFKLTNGVSSPPKADFDEVVKSEYLVPMPMITSAFCASRFAASVPVTPTAPIFIG
ncbi:hypothetical protein D3C78_1746520 [compost metagenome]